MRKSPRVLGCAIAGFCASAVWSAVWAQTPPAETAGGAKATTIEACSVLTREEIKNLSGKDPGSPRPSGSGDSTICYWEAASPKGSVTLHALAGNNYQSMDATLQAMIKQGKTARAVKVLGEDAIFVEQSGDVSSGTLFVKVGHYTLTIWREALPHGAAASVLPILTTLAKAAIPKLR